MSQSTLTQPTLTQLTLESVKKLRKDAAESIQFPELAAELLAIANALEQANQDRIAAEELLAEWRS
jgi:hypothetical protein